MAAWANKNDEDSDPSYLIESLAEDHKMGAAFALMFCCEQLQVVYLSMSFMRSTASFGSPGAEC